MRCLRLLPLVLCAFTASSLAQSKSLSLVSQPVVSSVEARTSAHISGLGKGVAAQPGSKKTKVAVPVSEIDFAPAVSYASGGFLATSMVVADVNRDGRPDVLVANDCANDTCSSNGTVGVLLDNADGTYHAAVNYGSGGQKPNSVVVADVNGDGNPDLLVLNECVDNACASGTIGVLLGHGDGTFKAAVLYSTGGRRPNSIVIQDVNGDGIPDLLVAQYKKNDVAGAIGVLLGKGDGTFQGAAIYLSNGLGARFLVVTDVNGDSKPDLLVTNNSPPPPAGSVSVLLNNGDGTFQAAITYGSGGGDARSLAVVDVNGDGHSDLLVVNYYGSTIGVLLGNGDGTFQTAVTYNPGYGVTSFAVGDLDGDGKYDLVASFYIGGVSVLLGNGDGTFHTAVPYDSGGYYSNPGVIADVDGDGKPDLVVANRCTDYNCNSNGTVGVLLGNGDGTFQPTLAYGSGGTRASSVVVADVNGDGEPDLVLANECDSYATCNGTVGVLINTKLGPIVRLSVTSLNFGNQAVGKISAPQYVTLTNTGSAPLTINSITGGSGEYSQLSNCPINPNTLGASKSCVISVRFTPSTTGAKTDSISISDNAPDNPQIVSLTGNGVVSKATLSTTSMVFGVRVVGTTSFSKTVKLTNTSSTVALNISGITASGDFVLANTVNQCPNSGSVPPKSSCNLAIEFSPTSGGTRYGTITITDSDPASPQIVGLSGTGTAVKLSAKKLNFGSVVVGRSSHAKIVKLTNVGSTPLSIAGISIGGTNAGDFAQVNKCGSSLGAGAMCLIKVTFKPTAMGARIAIIGVADSDPTSPQMVNLTGTGD